MTAAHDIVVLRGTKQPWRTSAVEHDALRGERAGAATRPAGKRQMTLDAKGFERHQTPPCHLMRVEGQGRIDGKMGDLKQGAIPFDGKSMGDAKIDERVLLAVGQIAAKGEGRMYGRP